MFHVMLITIRVSSECSVLQGVPKASQLDGSNSLNQGRKGSVCSLSKARALWKAKMPADAAATPVNNKAVLSSHRDDSQSGYVWKAVWQTGALTPSPVPSQALQRLSL